MPWAVLRFKLPEDQADLDLALKAGLLVSTLEEVREFLRVNHKYADEPMSPAEVYSRVCQIIDEARVLE
jgi:hypothetical protein